MRKVFMKNQRSIIKAVLFFGFLLFLIKTPMATAQTQEFSAPGLIEAWAQVTMKAKTSGSIGSIEVKEGDHV